jgi:Mg-chelatase subunit ChlD
MDIVDKSYERALGNDINFFRVFTYYRLKLEAGQKLEPWQQSFMDLKYGLDLLERRGILKTSPAGERVLGGQGLSALLGYAVARNQGLMLLQAGIIRNRRLQSARSEEIRPFTAVNSFRDISVRHTIKEVARQHKELGNVRKSDFRVYNRPRKWLATDIVICLDTSGSMADHRKLIYERLAAAAITEAAKHNGDRTAVVTFESASNTPIALSDESNEQVNDYLATLGVKGGTNIADGLKCAVDLLTGNINHNKKHIFLITDGEPNAISEKAMKTLQAKKEMPRIPDEEEVLKEIPRLDRIRSTGTPQNPDEEEVLKEISRFGIIRSTGTPQDPDEEQLLKEIPRDPNEEAVLLETRRAAAKGINVSVVFLAADQMKGYNFVKSVARAGNGSVIVLDCGDETPIIPELVGKR